MTLATSPSNSEGRALRMSSAAPAAEQTVFAIEAATGEFIPPFVAQEPSSAAMSREQELALAASEFGWNMPAETPTSEIEVPLYRDAQFLAGVRSTLRTRIQERRTAHVNPLVVRALATGMRYPALHPLIALRADRLLTAMMLHERREQKVTRAAEIDADSQALLVQLSRPPKVKVLDTLKYADGEQATPKQAARLTDTWRMQRKFAGSDSNDLAAIEAHMSRLGVPIPASED